ncbi:hypothetical protein MRX96_036020 [Rhipicephalus microplus]
MLVAIEAGRHRPAFFSASTTGRRRPGGAIAFPLLTLLELSHTFRHFCHPVRAFQFFLIGISTINSHFHRHSASADALRAVDWSLERRSDRLGARPSGGVGETHNVAEHRRRNKIL